MPRPQSSSASRFTAGRCVGLFYFPTLGNSRGRAYVSFLGGYLAREKQHDKISADRGRRGQYYDFSDPYRGLYDFFAVPPYIPGYTYRHMRMPGR